MKKVIPKWAKDIKEKQAEMISEYKNRRIKHFIEIAKGKRNES
jgi:hypothetical protein